MDKSMSITPVSLTQEAQALIDSLDVIPSDVELLEIKESLHHLGKAFHLYHLQELRGEL